MGYSQVADYSAHMAAGGKQPQLLPGQIIAQQAQQQQQQMMAQQELVKQAGQFASSPMADPTKNPQAMEMMNGITGQGGPEEADPNA